MIRTRVFNVNGITIGEGCDPRGEDFLRARGAIISRDSKGYITVTGNYSISSQEANAFLASLAANAPGTSSRDSEAIDAAPVDTAPVDTAPVDAAPVDTAPADAVPAETAPADAVPADAVPAETAPVDAAPAETAPVDAAPADTTTVEREETSFNNSMAAATDSGAKIELLHAFHRTAGIHNLSAETQRKVAIHVAEANDSKLTKSLTDKAAQDTNCKALFRRFM